MFGSLTDNVHNFSIRKIGDVSLSISAGGDKPNDISTKLENDYIYPIYSNGEQNDGLFGYARNYKFLQPAVTISARGTIGFAAFRKEGKFTPIVRLLCIVPSDGIIPIYLTYYLNFNRITGGGSGVKQLTVPMLKNEFILVPPLDLQNAFASFVKKVDKLKFVGVSRFLRSVIENRAAFDYLVSTFSRNTADRHQKILLAKR